MLFAVSEIHPHLHSYLLALRFFFLPFKPLTGGENKPYQDVTGKHQDSVWHLYQCACARAQKTIVEAVFLFHPVGHKDPAHSVRIGGVPLYVCMYTHVPQHRCGGQMTTFESQFSF